MSCHADPPPLSPSRLHSKVEGSQDFEHGQISVEDKWPPAAYEVKLLENVQAVHLAGAKPKPLPRAGGRRGSVNKAAGVPVQMVLVSAARSPGELAAAKMRALIKKGKLGVSGNIGGKKAESAPAQAEAGGKLSPQQARDACVAAADKLDKNRPQLDAAADTMSKMMVALPIFAPILLKYKFSADVQGAGAFMAAVQAVQDDEIAAMLSYMKSAAGFPGATPGLKRPGSAEEILSKMELPLLLSELKCRDDWPQVQKKLAPAPSTATVGSRKLSEVKDAMKSSADSAGGGGSSKRRSTVNIANIKDSMKRSGDKMRESMAKGAAAPEPRDSARFGMNVDDFVTAEDMADLLDHCEMQKEEIREELQQEKEVALVEMRADFETEIARLNALLPTGSKRLMRFDSLEEVQSGAGGGAESPKMTKERSQAAAFNVMQSPPTPSDGSGDSARNLQLKRELAQKTAELDEKKFEFECLQSEVRRDDRLRVWTPVPRVVPTALLRLNSSPLLRRTWRRCARRALRRSCSS